MPGETVTLLLGAQGGDEESFACLYAVTNPVLVRYLRVVSDADPAALSVATWSTLLDGMSGCVADEDDDWLELAVGTARGTALASAAAASAGGGSAGLASASGTAAGGSSSTPTADGAPAVPALPAHHGPGPGPDRVDAGVAMLRACGPAVADVLAMGVVAGLGRDSIARITGQQPTEVLALVHEGEDTLALPLETLIATMQVPGSPAEVADLPAVRPLFAAQSHAALTAGAAGAASAAAAVAASTGPTGSSTAPKVAAAVLGPGAATAATTPAAAATTSAAAASTAAASAGDSGVVDLLTWGHPDPEKSSFVVLPTPQPSRWTSIGASAAAWTIAVGGLGAAAAMSGVIPAAIDGLFGNDGNRPVVVAQGPVRPGEVPSPDDGGPVTTPGPSDGQPGSQGPSEPGTGGGGTSSGDGGVVVVSAGFGTASGAGVAVPAVVTNPPSAPSTPSAPTTPGPGAEPPTSTPPPPTTGGGTSGGSGKVKGAGNAYAYGKSHPKHSTGKAKGHAKTAKAPKAPKAKPAAKSQTKSAAAKARAAAQAVKAAAKAAAAKAKSAKSRA